MEWTINLHGKISQRTSYLTGIKCKEVLIVYVSYEQHLPSLPPSLPTSLSGEVLSKLPVVQHLLFGSIIQCTWGAGTGAGSADRGGVFESKDGMADKSLLSKSACALNASSDSV